MAHDLDLHPSPPPGRPLGALPRRAALAAAFLCAVVGAWACRLAAAAAPNVILIVADDLGYGDLGCYGQERILTPNLDRLAAEGTRFTQFYSGSTVCAPARCSLMTGLHTGHARIRGNGRVPLEPEDFTVAELLHEAGYATAMVGKWGLGEPGTTGVPDLQGFDEWFGFLNQRHAHNYYPEYLWRNGEKVRLVGNVAEDGVSSRRTQYAHDLFTREALAYLETRATTASGRSRPFFLYLPYTIPHANNEGGRDGGNGMEVPSDGPYEQRDWPAPQRSHAAMITRLDADVGRIVRRLRELGLEESTLVLFSSDNGPHREGGADPEFFESAGGLRGIKRDLYEGGIRVPLIARWPGVVPAGRTSEAVGAFWDVLPTLAELAGAEPPAGIDGVSLAPVLRGGEPAPRDGCLYWEFHERGFRQAVRSGDWKAVRHGDGPLELYDLRSDPGEVHDIAATHPDVVARLADCLAAARTESERWPRKG